MHPVLQIIQQTFTQRGTDQYGEEVVNQLQHALQSGLLAENAGASEHQIVAALLHDIGHILQDHALPADSASNLDDKHEWVGNAWLKQHFGSRVADPVRLHVIAKRYLCTKQASYQDQLSPTSLKSFHDQGGCMNEEEIRAFESEPHYAEALELRRWDDLAKEPSKQTPALEHFMPLIQRCLT